MSRVDQLEQLESQFAEDDLRISLSKATKLVKDSPDARDEYSNIYESRHILYQVCENLAKFSNGTLMDGLTDTVELFQKAVALAKEPRKL